MLWSNSAWHLYCRCPRAWGYRYRSLLVPRETPAPLADGTAWHDTSRAVLKGEEVTLDGMGQYWFSHNLTRYPQGGRMFHEVPYYLTKAGILIGPRKHGLIGVIDTFFEGDELWIIERKTASQLRGWQYYRATTQYWSYVAVADEIERQTGRHVRIAYDEIRKAIPREPNGLVCKKCHGNNAACPQCFGTNVTGISKTVVDTTTEIALAWLDRYPHIKDTPEVVEYMDKIGSHGDRFNAWYEDTPEDREYVRERFKDFRKTMNKTRAVTLPNYGDCGRCDYLELCWHQNLILFQRQPAEWSTGVHSESIAELIGVCKHARKH